jgi:hypothetical protein
VTPTHADVLAAIDKARPPLLSPTASEERLAAHCDDLRATAERHVPYMDTFDVEVPVHACCDVCLEDWPCPDYQRVIDRLTAWGAL